MSDKINRSEQISRVEDNRFEDVKIGLYDIDGSVKYYFDNIILPKIDTGFGLVDVPIVYSSPTRWASVKKHGTFRDKDGKIQCPIVTYKRTSISKNDSMPVNKISAENPQLFYSYQERYNSKNKYSQFSKLTGMNEAPKMHNVIIPDYVILSYDLIIWTTTLRQMNKMIELLNFYAGSYWGTKKWKFKTEMNDFSDASEVGADSAKVIKWNCSLTLNGYIVPDIYAKHLPNTVNYAPETLIVNFDTATTSEEFVAKTSAKTVTTEVGGGGSDEAASVFKTILQYIDKSNQKIADDVTTNTATFNGVSIAVSPAAYLETNIDDFTFFVNGVLLDNSVVASFTQVGNDVILTLIIDPSLWVFGENDEVIAIGKFN